MLFMGNTLFYHNQSCRKFPVKNFRKPGSRNISEVISGIFRSEYSGKVVSGSFLPETSGRFGFLVNRNIPELISGIFRKEYSGNVVSGSFVPETSCRFSYDCLDFIVLMN